MKRLTIVLLTTALVCHSQSPIIKGHTLGESVQEFTARADDTTKGLMVACANTHVLQLSTCRDLLELQKTGNSDLTCYRPEVPLGVCRNFDGHATFVGNKLVDVDIEVYGAQFEDVLADTETKFGKPEETHTSTMQNGYGAKIDTQVASWTAPGYMAELLEMVSANMTKYPMLHLIDRAYYDSKHKPHSSVLD